jgi:hypothetical protein
MSRCNSEGGSNKLNEELVHTYQITTFIYGAENNSKIILRKS